MVLQISLVLLIFFFFFLTYMVTKGWRWFHVVCLVAVFLNSIAFFFFAAFTLKAQQVWRTKHDQQEARLEEFAQDIKLIKYGPAVESLDAEDSIRSAKNALARAVIDRGRVWRNCAPQNVGYDQASGLLTATLSIPPRQAPAPAAPANPDDPDAPAPAPAAGANQAAMRHLMEEKIILFAFLEHPVDPEFPGDPSPYKVPSWYLGEFYATGVTANSVTLQSVIPPSEFQVRVAEARSNTWALYEVMPSDGHKYFVGTDGQVDQDFITNLLSPERMRLVVPAPAEPAITQEQYEAMIQQYLRDGQPAREEDPPERKWVKVQFVQDYETKVNAERPEVLTIENFNSQGQARNIQLLQRDSTGGLKENTSFAPGEEVVMDAESANRLEQQGIVTKVEEIYVRQLRDYEYSFHKIHRRIVDLEESIRNTDRDIAKANEAIEKIRQQIAYREDEKAKLIEDRGHFNDELEKLAAYQKELTTFRDNLSRRLSALYQHANALEIQLGEMQAALADQIEARAARAVAEVGTGAGQN